jgi:3-methyl-2-oxobutanoate hydroxymethyltransferase
MPMTVRRFVRGPKPLCVVTAYDYPSARLADQAGVDAILVGDSLGQVVQGYPDTLSVTLDEVIYHTKMVARAAQDALVIGDMPFMSYQVSTEQALVSAGRLMKEARCAAVKLEGGSRVAETVLKMVECGIPVMGHIGYTPQSVHTLGSGRAQGRALEAARLVLADALDLEAAGAFAIVLEVMPHRLASLITAQLHVPTIGIGAGPGCSGQVLVWHDLLAMPDLGLRHSHAFAQVGETALAGLLAYRQAVTDGSFPTLAHSVEMADEVAAQLEQEITGPTLQA